MTWREFPIDQELFPRRRMWLLVNDKGDELATIEHFADGDEKERAFYLWIMDPDEPDMLMRCGPQTGNLETVKASTEARLGQPKRKDIDT